MNEMKKANNLYVAIPFEIENNDNPHLEIQIVSISVPADKKKKLAESLEKAYEGRVGFSFVPSLEIQLESES